MQRPCTYISGWRTIIFLVHSFKVGAKCYLLLFSLKPRWFGCVFSHSSLIHVVVDHHSACVHVCEQRFVRCWWHGTSLLVWKYLLDVNVFLFIFLLWSLWCNVWSRPRVHTQSEIIALSCKNNFSLLVITATGGTNSNCSKVRDWSLVVRNRSLACLLNIVESGTSTSLSDVTKVVRLLQCTLGLFFRVWKLTMDRSLTCYGGLVAMAFKRWAQGSRIRSWPQQQHFSGGKM